MRLQASWYLLYVWRLGILQPPRLAASGEKVIMSTGFAQYKVLGWFANKFWLISFNVIIVNNVYLRFMY